MAEHNDDRAPETAAAGAPATGARNGRKRGRVMRILIAVALLSLISYGVYWLLVARWYVSTDDAYVQGDTVSLMPQVSGTVVAVNAALTQYVHRGEVVVRLDDADARVALARSEADLAQTVRSTAQLFQQVDVDAALVAQRQAQLAQARSDRDRNRTLAPQHGVSKQALEHSEVAYRNAAAALQQAQHQLTAARAATAHTTVADHPQVKQAEARVRDAWLALARTRILAPVSGYVGQKNVQVGQQATPGKPLLSIVPLQDAYVSANFKENQLGAMRIGQPVTMTADLYGSSITYHGKVLGFSSGTGAAFSVLPPENATGNWIKVVQRLPVRISLDPDEIRKNPLMIGLSMSVDVDIHHRNGKVLSQAPAFDGVSSTDVYAHQDQGVDAVIQRIVNANVAAAAPARH